MIFFYYVYDMRQPWHPLVTPSLELQHFGAIIWRDHCMLGLRFFY